MDDSHLDQAIDDVARDLTAHEPDPLFRARVIERLPVGRATRRWVWVAAAAAGVGTAAAVVFIARPVPAERDLPPLESSVAAPGLGLQVIGRSPGRPALQPPRRSPERLALRSPRRSSETLALEATASAVEALAPPRLEAPSITLEEIDAGKSIRISQLDPIAPISIAPIGEPEGDRR
jgi:hypothetical protein